MALALARTLAKAFDRRAEKRRHGPTGAHSSGRRGGLKAGGGAG